MAYWETADENPSARDYELEFARIWKDTPKIVFSKTLEKAEGNARLVRGSVAEEVARLKDNPGNDLSVGGAGLASTFTKLDLIDEYRPFVSPVVLGGGTPYFPALDERINLELVETRTFGSRVVTFGTGVSKAVARGPSCPSAPPSSRATLPTCSTLRVAPPARSRVRLPRSSRARTDRHIDGELELLRRHRPFYESNWSARSVGPFPVFASAGVSALLRPRR
jgi:dihydrofolate reductase